MITTGNYQEKPANIVKCHPKKKKKQKEWLYIYTIMTIILAFQHHFEAYLGKQSDIILFPNFLIFIVLEFKEVLISKLVLHGKGLITFISAEV